MYSSVIENWVAQGEIVQIWLIKIYIRERERVREQFSIQVSNLTNSQLLSEKTLCFELVAVHFVMKFKMKIVFYMMQFEHSITANAYKSNTIQNAKTDNLKIVIAIYLIQ